MSAKHLIRYGTPAEAKFLLGKFLPTYDCLLLNANMVAHAPSAIAKFVMQKSKFKPYVIDPQTHALQHDITFLESKYEDGPNAKAPKIKSSVEKLLKQYGNFVYEHIVTKRRSIAAADFKDDIVIKHFVENVVKYQQNAIAEKFKEGDAWKFVEFVRNQTGSATLGNLEPDRVVAPYFFLDTADFKKCLQLNSKFFEAATKHIANPALQIVVSKELLRSESYRNQLIDEYQKFKTVAPTIYLWIDDFSEHKADIDDLKSYINLVRGLGAIAPVINLYGGYFSIVLSQTLLKGSLVGISHGLEYGESRPVVPVGGGIPTAKYYFPPAHMRMEFREAVRAINLYGVGTDPKAFAQKICDCEECKRNVKKNVTEDFAVYGQTKEISYTNSKGTEIFRELPLPESRDNSVRHYLWCKRKEYSSHISLEQVAQSLLGAYQILRPSMPTAVGHLSRWCDALGIKPANK